MPTDTFTADVAPTRMTCPLQESSIRQMAQIERGGIDTAI